jgi:hypothetical protein
MESREARFKSASACKRTYASLAETSGTRAATSPPYASMSLDATIAATFCVRSDASQRTIAVGSPGVR